MGEVKYIFEYLDENDYRKKERSVRKYNMLAYKKMMFEYYTNLRKGKFLGKLVETKGDVEEKYVLELPTDSMFVKVHGKLELHYTVYKDRKVIMLENITPEDILLEGHRAELATYKGVMISKSHTEKDMFKINLLNMLNKDK